MDTAFTLVDFVAADPRFAGCFASVAAGAEPSAEPGDAPGKGENRLVAVDEYLRLSTRDRSRALPCVLLLDEQNHLRRAVVDEKLVEAAQRCLGAWRSLQELGGIGNSHAQAAVQEARRAWEAEKAQLLAKAHAGAQAGAQVAAQATPAAQAPAAPTPAAVTAAAAEPATPEAVAPAPSSDDPWIETVRCTSCNECTQINDRLFAYNEDQRAYIRDPDAGTYRDLVQAAETCQVAIIHPGKPRNPNESGMEELLKRAEPFL
jgi:ferredoxin